MAPQITEHPVQLTISYPMRMSRGLLFLRWFLLESPERIARWRPLLNWVLVFPLSITALMLLLMAISFALGWWAILILGRLPRGLFNVIAGALFWQTRIVLYAYWLTVRYPPLAWRAA